MLFTIAAMQMKCNLFNYCFKIITLLLLSSLFQNSLCNSDKYDVELNNKNCRAVTHRNATCKNGEVKVWNIYYNKQHSNTPFFQKNVNCLNYCEGSDDCVAVNVESNVKNKCYIVSSFSTSNLINKNNVDVFVLSCCILNSKLVKSINTKFEGPDTDKCAKWSSRTHFCSDPIWVSVLSISAANVFMENVNTQQQPDCMKACNDNRACVAFQYNTKTLECQLKYKHTSKSPVFSSGVRLYELHCCDTLLIIPQNKECLISNTCTSGTAVWTLFPDKNINSLLPSPTTLSPPECMKECAFKMNSKCFAVSISKSENCRFMTDNTNKDTASYLFEDRNSDAFVKSCCPHVDNPDIVSDGKKKKDDSFKCELLTNRYGFCANPQWIIYEKKFYSQENLGLIKIIKVNNEDICKTQCNELIGCLAFVYKTKSRECFLRYVSVEGNYLRDSDDHTYGNLECCSATLTPFDKICYVDDGMTTNNKCNQPDFSFTEVADGNVKCTNKKIIGSIKVSTIDHCRKACSNQDNCASFEVHMSNNRMQTHVDCILNEAIDVCQVDETVKTIRFYNACCKTMIFSDLKGKEFTPQCHNHVNEKIYSGNETVSSTGKACLHWKTVKPDVPLDAFPSKENNDHNKCRSLDAAVKQPWCIVSGSYLFETCNIRKCVNVYQNIMKDEICTAYEKKIGCQKGFEPRWILDTNITCNPSKSIHNTTAIDENECKEYCQNSTECHAFEIKFDEVQKAENCQFKSRIGYCMAHSDNTEQNSLKRWAIGCCHIFNYSDLEANSKPLRNCKSLKDKMPILRYDGDVTTSLSKADCNTWEESGSYFEKYMFRKKDMSHNFCLNLNNDPNGPWCMISGSYYYEYCTIPSCPLIYHQSDATTTCLQTENLKKKGCANNYEIKWIREKLIGKCHRGLLKDNIARFNTTDVDTCFEYCQMHKECVSFEYIKVNNVTNYCAFKKRKSNCPINKHGEVNYRYWLGCCAKPIVIDIDQYTRPPNDDILGLNRKLVFHALIPMFIIALFAIIGCVISYSLCFYYKPMPFFIQNRIKARQISDSTESLKSNVAIVNRLDEIDSQ